MDEQSQANGLAPEGSGGQITDGTGFGAADADTGEPTVPAAGDGGGSWSDGVSSGYEATGRPDVDRILERLTELEGAPPTDHVDVYEDAHRRLHETLLAAGEGREDPSVAP